MQKIVIRVQWNSCHIAYQTKPDKQALTHSPTATNEKKTKFRQFSLQWKTFLSPGWRQVLYRTRKREGKKLQWVWKERKTGASNVKTAAQDESNNNATSVLSYIRAAAFWWDAYAIFRLNFNENVPKCSIHCSLSSSSSSCNNEEWHYYIVLWSWHQFRATFIFVSIF